MISKVGKIEGGRLLRSGYKLEYVSFPYNCNRCYGTIEPTDSFYDGGYNNRTHKSCVENHTSQEAKERPLYVNNSQ